MCSTSRLSAINKRHFNSKEVVRRDRTCVIIDTDKIPHSYAVYEAVRSAPVLIEVHAVPGYVDETDPIESIQPTESTAINRLVLCVDAKALPSTPIAVRAIFP